MQKEHDVVALRERRTVCDTQPRYAVVNGKFAKGNGYRAINRTIFVYAKRSTKNNRPKTVREAIMKDWERHVPGLDYLADR